MADKEDQRRNPFGKLFQRARAFASEPLPWAMCLTLTWIWTKQRSIFYSYLLKAPGLNVGPGCSIKGIRRILIGRDVSIFGGLWLEAVLNYRGQSFSPNISIGDRVCFSKDVHITCIERIEIGKDVLFGSRVYVSDHNHGRYSGKTQSHPEEPPSTRELFSSGPVIIENNVWIGDNVVIIGPAIIGAGSIVAANSVVKGDVPSFMMVAGTPAKAIKRFDLASNTWVKHCVN